MGLGKGSLDRDTAPPSHGIVRKGNLGRGFHAWNGECPVEGRQSQTSGRSTRGVNRASRSIFRLNAPAEDCPFPESQALGHQFVFRSRALFFMAGHCQANDNASRKIVIPWATLSKEVFENEGVQTSCRGPQQAPPGFFWCVACAYILMSYATIVVEQVATERGRRRFDQEPQLIRIVELSKQLAPRANFSIHRFKGRSLSKGRSDAGRRAVKMLTDTAWKAGDSVQCKPEDYNKSDMSRGQGWTAARTLRMLSHD